MSKRKTWNFKELRHLCLAKGLPDSQVYQDTLLWKQWRASYHAEQYREIWMELFSSSNEIQVGGKGWNKAQFASEAHVEAMAQALHSMADILAQIINKTVLCAEFSEGDVKLSKILNELKKKPQASKIVERINKLQNSVEFRYIDAFVNTIKHRRLLDRVFHVEYGEGKRNDKAVCFRKFEYKGSRYGFIWATDIIGPYRDRILKLISEISNAVNEYVLGIN